MGYNDISMEENKCILIFNNIWHDMLVLNTYELIISLGKREVLRKHNYTCRWGMGKIAASVLLKLFINANDTPIPTPKSQA